MELTFCELTKERFGEFEGDLLSSELLYPESIRSAKEDYLEVLETEGAIAIVALLGPEFVGCAVAYPPTKAEEEEYEITADIKKSVYLFNLSIGEMYQGKGYGARLLGELIKIAKERRYSKLFGHFREGKAAALSKKFGSVERKICENWESTGETYHFCEINLSQVLP